MAESYSNKLQNTMREVEQPLERLSLGRKHNALPPIIAGQVTFTPKLILGGNNKDSTSARYFSLDKTDFLDVPENEIQRSDAYIDVLIKQNKEVAKNRANDFDTLCANLVKKHEREVDTRNNKRHILKNAASRRLDYKSKSNRSFEYSSPERENTIISTHSDNTNESTEAADARKNRPERPKSAKYGGRTGGRPRTGYGRRTRTEET